MPLPPQYGIYIWTWERLEAQQVNLENFHSRVMYPLPVSYPIRLLACIQESLWLMQHSTVDILRSRLLNTFNFSHPGL